MLKPNVEGTGRPMQNLGIRKMLLFLWLLVARSLWWGLAYFIMVSFFSGKINIRVLFLSGDSFVKDVKHEYRNKSKSCLKYASPLVTGTISGSMVLFESIHELTQEIS
jgi:hypothetical protein